MATAAIITGVAVGLYFCAPERAEQLWQRQRLIVPAFALLTLCAHVGFPWRHFRHPGVEDAAIAMTSSLVVVEGVAGLMRLGASEMPGAAESIGAMLYTVIGATAFVAALRRSEREDDALERSD